MDFTIPCSRRIKELVANGVITIDVHITRDGTDVWARSTQPHPKLGVQTCTSHTLEGIERLLAKVVVKSLQVPEGALAVSTDQVESAKASAIGVGTTARPPEMGEGQIPDLGFKTIDQALAYVVDKKLDRSKNSAGVLGFLPQDSLTPTDLDRPAKHLYARICSVVEKLSTKKLLSRIASQSDILSVQGASTLSEWWSKSTGVQKATLLTKSKHFHRDGSGNIRFHGYWLDKLDSTPHPFRNAEAQVVQHEEESSAEEEEWNPSYSSTDEETKIQGAQI